MECAAVDTAASSTPVAAEEPPFSITDTQLQSPRSPRVARPPRSSVTPLTTTTTTTSIVSAPSSPPLPARSPLRPAARSISTQSTTSGTFDFSGSIPAGTTTDTNPKTNPGTLLVSSSNVSTLTLDSPVSPLTPTDDFGAAPVGTGIPAIIHMRDRHNSFPSLNGLIDQVREEFGITENEEDATQPLRLKSAGATSATSAETNADDGNNKVLLKKSLHLDNRPDSPPLSIDLSLEEEQMRTMDSTSSTTTTNINRSTATSISSSTSPSSSAPASVASHERPPTTMTRRHHALHELLSSERAYASDLALIREVHIPLALGQTVPLPNVPLTPPPTFPSTSGSSGSSGSGSSGSSGPGSSSSTSSSNNSSRTVSTASSESLGGNAPPPMSPEDAKIIFSNVSELAMFADMFTEELELALGSVVEGGQGEDFVGALFLRVIPELERPYKHYITRHPTALQHLQNLPQTPALQAYLSYTQTVASSVSHAWDLASLLIKPVQRLLKYPLLLAAIIDETPDAHPDKENLRNARVRVEEIARNVNEGRRRAEVVKDVLTSKTPKKPSAPVGVAASVNLSKVKSLRHGGVTAATMRVSQLAEGGNSEAARVEAMQAELKRLEVFAQQFAKNVVDWGKMMSNVMLALRTWALSFGKVIGLSAEQGSEAFDAFLGVVTTGLLPLTADLDAAINERLLRDMAHLLMTMNQPLKLLASMNEQEPYHYHLLTMPVSQKNRPPASLLAASTNYLALRGQLAAELPTYLALMHRGFAVFVRRLAGIQTRFWRDVKERWAELWEMLRVEGELNAGWEETCAVWCARWSDVDEVVKALGIMQPIPHLQPVVAQAQAQAQMQAQLGKGYATLQQQQQQQLEKEKNYAQFEQYFGYPEFYVPMTPNLSLPKDRERQLEKEREREREREQKEREKEQKQRDREQKDREKLERHHSSKSSSGSKGINIAAVNSMFAALEPAHSPVHKKQSAVNVTNMLASLYPSHPLDGSMYAGSTTNVANANGSMYSVSGPMPLGSVASFNHGKDGREAKRGRGRGASDASTMASGWSGASKSGGSAASGSSTSRRPSSQDSARSRPRPDTKSPNVNANSRRRTQGYGLADEFDEYMAVNGTTIPPSYEGGQYPYSPGGGGSRAKHLTRMKSMPLSHQTSLDKASMLTTTTNRTVGQGPSLGNGGGYAVEGDRVYYQPPLEESWEEYQQHQESPSQPQQREKERGRDRSLPANSRSQTMPVLPMATTTTSPKTKSKERPSHARKRSGSTKSITAFFTGSDRNSNPAPPPDPQPLTASQRDSWVSKPAKYVCQVIHPCRPPASVQYYSFPFFTLQEGDLYQVLQEAGHPSIHPKLPLYVDDGEDCLLLCRDGNGVVGWALASFLEPVTMET